MDAEQLLRRLLSHFYKDTVGGLTWSYQEDISLSDIDQPLADDLKKFINTKEKHDH